MKNYDYELAKLIIDTLDNLDVIESAVLGMREDWCWTADYVWVKDEGYIQDLKDGLNIMGIDGSRWATPAILIRYTDGTERMFKCYKGDADIDYLETVANSVFWASGEMSKPVQELIDDIELENFEL